MASFTSGADVAKAGWLYRQSSFLHRWKKNWFSLDRQGDLRYFESPEHPTAKHRIVVRACVLRVNAGPDCRNHDPPEGKSSYSCGFLELVLREQETLVLCAESLDDMKAWQVALEQARTLVLAPPPGFVTPAVGMVPPAPGIMAPSPMIYGHPGYVHYSSPFGLGTTSYPGQVLSTVPTQQVYHTQPGHTTTVIAMPQVVMDDDPYRYSYRHGYHHCRFGRRHFRDW